MQVLRGSIVIVGTAIAATRLRLHRAERHVLLKKFMCNLAATVDSVRGTAKCGRLTTGGSRTLAHPT